MERNNPLPKRKRIRLDRATYDGPGLVAMVTVATRDRVPVFSNHEFTLACLEVLRRTKTESSVEVPAYCFMPDHAHFLVHLKATNNLIDIIRLFKGRTSRAAVDYGIPRNFWQRKFYDHLLRPDEEDADYMRYILENPIRAGLTAYVDDYPFSGTLEFDVDSLADLFP